MNRAIELHDSEVEIVERRGNHIAVGFSHAYVHESHGVPGVDSGTGWSYRATLLVQSQFVDFPHVKWPFSIYDGDLTIGSRKHSNYVPIPLDTNENIELCLQVLDADDTQHTLVIRGTKITLELHGDPKYIEDVKGKGTYSPT